MRKYAIRYSFTYTLNNNVVGVTGLYENAAPPGAVCLVAAADSEAKAASFTQLMVQTRSMLQTDQQLPSLPVARRST